MADNQDWRLLQVEDDEEDFMITRDMLSQFQGRKVTLDWAATYDEGLQKLARTAYDAVIVDYDLGRPTGIELIRHLVSGGYAAPLILLTGRGTYAVDVEAMHAGATLYLTKNEINPLLLERSIRYAIERKQTEQAVLERDRKLSVALEAAQLGTWVYTCDDDQFYLDVRAQEMYRADRTVVAHQQITEAYLPLEDRRHMRAALQEAIDPAGAGRYQAEYRILQADGSLRWLNACGLTEFEGEGAERRAVRLVGASRDITWEKQARLALEDSNAALRASAARFRHLADAMPQLVWTAQPDGRVDYCNQRYCQYSGIAPREAGQWEWGAVMHPDDLPVTVAAWNRARATGETYEIEHRMRMADGSYRWHLSRGVPAYDEHGRLTQWYGTATDIHDFRQIQATLQQREQRLRRLFESNLIGIVARDAAGNVLEANRAYLELTGYSAAAVAAGQLNIHTITPPEYRSLDQQALEQILAEGHCKPYEKEYVRLDGSRVPVLVGYSLYDNSRAEMIGYVLDLSELKQAQAELEVYANKLKRSNEELENFAFVASHDMQEPLRKILAFGRSLRRQLEGQLTQEAQVYLDRMQLAAERMQAMIDGLLDLSRVNTRGGEFQHIDLTDVAEEVASDLELRIRASAGQVRVGTLPIVEGDARQLHQLLLNLVGNALKYHRAEAPPVVEITGCCRAGVVQVMVQDNGIGFEPAQANEIFQPFVRLHAAGRYEGAGIGLAICRKIVERHGGSLTAAGCPGQGATFTITLPGRQTGRGGEAR